MIEQSSYGALKVIADNLIRRDRLKGDNKGQKFPPRPADSFCFSFSSFETRNESGISIYIIPFCIPAFQPEKLEKTGHA